MDDESAIKAIEFLKTVHDHCLEYSRDARFDKDLRRDGTIVCLYGSIIEHCGTLIELIELRRRSAVAPIYRALIESHVEYLNLVKSIEYYEHYLAGYHDHWIKVLNSSRLGNKFLSHIATSGSLESNLNFHKQALDQLKKKGRAPLKTIEKFRRSDMSDVYESIFRMESSLVHGGMSSIMRNHLELDGESYRIVFYKKSDPSEFGVYLDSAITILLDSSESFLERWAPGQIPELTTLKEQFDELRQSYKIS